MRLRHVFAALPALAVLGACNDDDPTFVRTAPQAYVRYVNASPDSPPVTARFVDLPENWRSADGVGFRGNSGYYQAVTAGERRLRVFRLLSAVVGGQPVDTASRLVVEQTVRLEPGTYYTMLQTGRVLAEPAAATVTLFTDTVPTAVPTGSIFVRAYHAAEGVGPVSVTVTSDAAGSDAAGTINSVAFRARSAYAQVPALTGTALYRFSIAPAGTTNTLFSATPAVPGTAAVAGSATQAPLGAIPGVRVGGSALSVVVFPAAIPGSPAASAATANPTIDVLPDNRP